MSLEPAKYSNSLSYIYFFFFVKEGDKSNGLANYARTFLGHSASQYSVDILNFIDYLCPHHPF
jgi:hypothetical protein